MTNQEVSKLLNNVAAAYSIKDEKKYRFQIIAYQKAADAIESSPTQVKDLFSESQLQQIPGVGSSMKAHLEELLTTGSVKQFETILDSVPRAMFPLLDITSFGPKKAFKLVTAFDLKNPETVIADIEAIAKEGKIASLESFGEKSQKDILQAIAEYKLGKTKSNRMALPFAYELAETMVAYLKKSKEVHDAVPLGSLRRMRETIGDLDIAVATSNHEAVIAHFLAYPYIERVIEKGESGASILVNGGKQIDLLTQPKESFGSLLQHFTGSKNHNVHLRELAMKKGLSLSERGIKDKATEKMSTYDTEKKFYEALDMDWVPPEIREDTGEIELAKERSLPKLVEVTDIIGDFHIHSSFPMEESHDAGQSSIEVMLEKAKSLGYSYLAFSEHNPSISKHSSEQTYNLIKKRGEYIDKLYSNNNSVRILKMLETDILTDGSLAIDDKSLAILDATIVSIHSSFAMDKKTMTDRVLKGLSHPKAKILAHPTGRLLNQRTGYELEWERVFEFCVKNNKALEVNAWPQRLDLPDVLVRQAVNHGIKLAIDTDSHEVSQMDMMRYGVAVARRGWATKSDILNCMTYNELSAWLQS